MISLNLMEIDTLLNNMAKDNVAQVRELALLESPKQAEFADEDTGEKFSHRTVYAIWENARNRTYRCYSCKLTQPLSKWSRDSSGVDLCASCLTEAENENEHSDYGHETPTPECPTCRAEHPELALLIDS